MRGEGRQPHCNSPPTAPISKRSLSRVAHWKALAEAEKIVVED